MRKVSAWVDARKTRQAGRAEIRQLVRQEGPRPRVTISHVRLLDGRSPRPAGAFHRDG
jgi:hypothetical protein